MSDPMHAQFPTNDGEKKELRTRLLGTLKSGEHVFDRPRSHLHMNDAFETHLPRALERIDAMAREFFSETIDFGNQIGYAKFIEVAEGDEIVYARRMGRRGPSRFVKNRVPNSTSLLTVILKKVEGCYIAVTGFLGPRSEPEPWDPHADEKLSTDFWKKHAMVWGSEMIVPDSETRESYRYWKKLPPREFRTSVREPKT